MSLTVTHRLKNRTTASTTATPTTAKIVPNSCFSVSLGGSGSPSRSKKGRSSSSMSGGRRVNTERVPSGHGCSEKAEKSTAKGGQYSANLLQRAAIIRSAVEKSRKKNE